MCIMWQQAEKIPSAILGKVSLYNELLGFKLYSCTRTLPALWISAANIKVNLEKDKAWDTRLLLMNKLSDTAHYHYKISKWRKKHLQLLFKAFLPFIWYHLVSYNPILQFFINYRFCPFSDLLLSILLFMKQVLTSISTTSQNST